MQTPHREWRLTDQPRAHNHLALAVDQANLTGFFRNDTQQSLIACDAEEYRLGMDIIIEMMGKQFLLKTVIDMQFFSIQEDEVGILVTVEVFVKEEVLIGVVSEIGTVGGAVVGHIEQFPGLVGSQKQAFATVGGVGIDICIG